MSEDKQERLKACLKELAALLYEEADTHSINKPRRHRKNSS
jgi:hypothetical protein